MKKYTRTVDCEIWAKKKITQLQASHDTLYVIEPMEEFGGGYLDVFHVLVEGKLVKVGTSCSHHYLVCHDGVMYDEHYPEGLNESEYLQRNVTYSDNQVKPDDQTWIEGDYEVTR